MIIENPKKFVRSLAIFIFFAIILIVIIRYNQNSLKLFLEFIRDRDAINAFLDRIGIIGPLVVIGLLGLQIFIPWLPAEPTLLASAYAYGFLPSFLMGWLVTVAVSQLVYYLARWAGRPLVERMVPKKQLEKWTRLAREKGTVFFIFAFVLPPIPTDMMIYVGGISGISGWNFFLANLIGRMPLVLLYSLVAGYGFQITPMRISALIVLGILLLAVWWYFVMRKTPGTK